ncbi:uncharacterized protein [Prorops nasuta]|uniref:uncharacterized protein n=1 Tax=Prorops nasuta TaxID=863751 RepID=UPI0034CE284E
MVKFSASVQVSTSLLQKTMDQQTGSLDYTNGEICPACGKCLEKEGPTNASFNMQTSNQLQCHVISPKSANLETNTASSGESIDSSTEGCLCSAPRSKRWSKNDKNIDNNKSENVISQQIYSSDRIGGQCCLDEITFTKDPPTISHNFNGQEECIYSRITAVHQQTSTIPFTKSSSKEHLSMTMTRSVVETTTTKTGVISPLPDAQFHADLNEMNFCGATQCKSNYENFLRAPCEKCAIGSIERENSDLLCTCGCGFFQGEYVEIPCCECTDSFKFNHTLLRMTVLLFFINFIACLFQ